MFRYEVAPTEVAAIFLEPVQGEGGYIMPPPRWVQRVRELCDRYGILLVADEVQSGMGRTGKMWAIELADVEPDILISAKGLASGLPLGAFAAKSDLMERWGAGAHGSTYGGSPVPCAAGLATLETIRSEDLVDNAAKIGEQLIPGLTDLHSRFPRVITDVRGVGLMLGIEFRTAELAGAVQQHAFEHGLLVLECGESTIRMSPPLIVNADQADTALRSSATGGCGLGVSNHVFWRGGDGHPVAASGHGAEIYDTSGRRYLDGSGGAVVVGIGHGVGEVADAIAEQARAIAYAHGTAFRSAALTHTPKNWPRCCRSTRRASTRCRAAARRSRPRSRWLGRTIWRAVRTGTSS